MTYLVIQTRTAPWTDSDFKMIADEDFAMVNHLYNKWVTNNGGGYGQQTGTVVRLVRVEDGVIREIGKVDFRE